MRKAFGAALLLASGLAITAAPARALEMVVAQVDKNTDGSMTYHFILKTDPGETLMRIPMKPARHSKRKPATDSDLKPAGIPI